jgi:predicted dehydrogenase
MAAKINRRTLLQSSIAALPLLAARPAPAAAPIKLPGPVRVGLIGLDGHFSEATRAAEMLPAVEITAFSVSNDRERRRGERDPQLAKAKVYDDYRALLDREKLDAVCICDQNHMRAETVLACLEHKIPTAAEKPLALSLADLDRIRERLAATKSPLTMLLPMRFEPHYLGMKAIVDRGEIGEPIALSGQKSYQLGERPDWMKKRATFGGTIPYIGIHLVDLLRFVSGRDMVEAAAFHSNVGFPAYGDMENNATVSYRLDNGGTASVRLDYLRPEAAGSHGDDRLRVAGSDGVVECQHDEVTLVTDGNKPHRVTELPGHTPLFVDFLDAVYNGAQPLLTAEECLRVTEIMLKTRDAADQRQVVRL